MPEPIAVSPSSKPLRILSRLLFSPRAESTVPNDVDLTREITTLSREEMEDLVALASSNHVIVRGLNLALETLRNVQDRSVQDKERIEWAEAALTAEHARIDHAIQYLDTVCTAFEEEGIDAIVIKSLDHWPDLGSDLDMYTNAAPVRVAEVMAKRFHAQKAERSWGDRLACKWNFLLPGLPEAIEVHIGRLGQTGEQTTLASRVVGRARSIHIGDHTFRVPSASDRLMISTLQRMYRHFYFRLCDIVDTTELSEAGAIDYTDLRASAEASGIWEGVATYLAIISDYVREYRGSGLELPDFVTNSARFGGPEMYFARDFLRFPIMPQSIQLYATQLGELLRKRKLYSGARLGLLPWLATAAAVGQKITGSDKGIW